MKTYHKISIILVFSIFFFFIELITGVIINSITLQASSLHRLSDIITNFIALLCEVMVLKDKNLYGASDKVVKELFSDYNLNDNQFIHKNGLVLSYLEKIFKLIITNINIIFIKIYINILDLKIFHLENIDLNNLYLDILDKHVGKYFYPMF